MWDPDLEAGWEALWCTRTMFPGSRNVPNVPDVPNVPNVPNNVPNVPGHGGQDGLLAEGYVAKISILATYPVAKPRHHSKPKSKLTSPDFNMLTLGVLG